MTWKDMLTILGTVLAAFLFLWSEIKALETRMDAMNQLLTNNLIALNRDLGELKGQAHTHNP